METIIVWCVLNLMHWSEERSWPEDHHYVAAVVEYEVGGGLEQNLNRYVALIEEAAAKNADIIVFPENTLSNGYSVSVPIHGVLKEYSIPALQRSHYDNVLIMLSTAARQNQIYVVVNIQELLNCSFSGEDIGETCPERKLYNFNSNLVFNRDGAIIDRYRKINLFREFRTTPALVPDLGVFETDFGVKFGHFVCFDILFQKPALQVVEKLDISDVIFTSMWFSEMPFLTAVQVQEAFAYSKNVNFLAAGANNVYHGSAGSGIYSGKAGALVSIMPVTNTTKLLVEKVPKIPGKINWTYSGPQYNPLNGRYNLYIAEDVSIPAHVTRILVPDFQEFELQHNDVACFFRVRMTRRNSKKEYVYRAAAFDGVRLTGGDTTPTGGMRTCAIYACLDDDIYSCAIRQKENIEDSSSTFEELHIRCRAPLPSLDPVTGTMDASYYANTLSTSIMPLKVGDYKIHFPSAEDFSGVYDMRLINTKAKILSFGIWARTFKKDGLEPSGCNSTMSFKFIYILVFILFACLILFVVIRYFQLKKNNAAQYFYKNAICINQFGRTKSL